MSTKTIQVKLPGRTGETDLRVILSRGSTVVNSSGAALTEASSSRGFFEGDVTSTFLVGFYDVEIANTLGTVLSGGYVYATGDDDEDLLVDDPAFSVVDEPSLGAVIESLETIAELQAAIAAKTGLIGTGNAATGGAPVSDAGNITEIIIGDDYSTANGNAFSWTVTLPTGATIGGASCFFGGQHSDPSLADANSWLVEGVVSAGPTETQAVITFNLLKADTAGLVAGDYNWSAEIRNDTGLESTRVRSKKTRRVAVVEKYT